MGDKEKNNKSVVGCPYCTKPIPSDAGQCPYCGTGFGSQTVSILRSVVKQALFDSDEDRREVERIPKQLKITYSFGKAWIHNCVGDIGVGGIFIPTEQPMDSGTRLRVKISLPDGENDLEVNGEVVWIRNQQIKTTSGKFSSGMGVRFLNLSPEDKKKIERAVKGSTPYP